MSSESSQRVGASTAAITGEVSAVYMDLRFACIALFCLSAPLILYIRAIRPEMPWWMVAVAVTTCGWILVNTNALCEHLEVDQEFLEEAACFEHPPSSTITTQESGEAAVDNPCALSDWIERPYEPLRGLIYGPLYLFWCALPYWLLIGRHARPRLTRHIVWLAVVAMAIEWTAILSGRFPIDCVGHAFEAFGVRGPFSFIVPPLAVGIAFTVSWIAATQVIQRIGSWPLSRS